MLMVGRSSGALEGGKCLGLAGLDLQLGLWEKASTCEEGTARKLDFFLMRMMFSVGLVRATALLSTVQIWGGRERGEEWLG